MKRNYIVIKMGASIIKVDFADILFIEKLGRQAIITTSKGEYVWYRTVEQMKEAFDERFLCCHRSYIINMDKIEKMEDRSIHLEGGYELFFGRETYRRAKLIFEKYIKGEI